MTEHFSTDLSFASVPANSQPDNIDLYKDRYDHGFLGDSTNTLCKSIKLMCPSLLQFYVFYTQLLKKNMMIAAAIAPNIPNASNTLYSVFDCESFNVRIVFDTIFVTYCFIPL